MSFMRTNRKVNGAPQPEVTQTAESKNQSAQKTLLPNDFPGKGEDRRFTVKDMPCAAINEARYNGGISGSGLYKPVYDANIPQVGIDATPVGYSGLKDR